jgi:hypothetical protein
VIILGVVAAGALLGVVVVELSHYLAMRASPVYLGQHQVQPAFG